MRRIALAMIGLACFALACSTISDSIKDRLEPPREVEGGILFRYEAPSAKLVTLAGNFNNLADQAIVTVARFLSCVDE